MKWIANLDLNKNELQNAKIQNLATSPSNPSAGQIYYHSGDKTFYGWNTITWVNLGQVLTGDNIITMLNGSSLKIDDDNLSTNVADAIAKRHSHNNMTVLNGMEVAFTNALKSKLDNVSAEATKVEQSLTNGNIKINGVEKTVYALPSTLPPSIITQDANNRFVTDAEKTLWNNKSNLTLGETSATAYRGDRGKTAYDHSQSAHAPSNAQKNSDITKAEIEAKLTGIIVSHGHDTTSFHNLTELFESTNNDELIIYDSTNGTYKKITKANLLSGLGDSDYVLIRHEEEFTATEGQTVFNLTKGQYSPGNSRVEVYVWGVRQPQTAFAETNSTRITLLQGVDAGTKVLISYVQLSSVMDYVHAQSHASGSSDPITPVMIGAQPAITGAATTITSSNLTASRAIISDASGKIAVSAISATELGYLSGVTSSVQTQINNKVNNSDVVAAAVANKILKLDANSKLPASITGNADGNAATATKLATQRLIGFTGDVSGSGNFDGSANLSFTATLANVGTAGTYTKVITDTKGRVTSGTSLAVEDIPTLTSAKISDFNTQVRSSRLDQMAAPTTSISLNNQKITSLAPPTSSSDAVTKEYADNLRAGLLVKDPVRVATTVNITLSGTQTIDGVPVVANDRVLVKDQSTPSQNGIYVVAAGTWSRAIDADNNPVGEIKAGLAVWVNEGTTNGDSRWVLTTNDPITVGTTALVFTKDFQGSDIIPGNGVLKSGNTISLGTPGTLTPSTTNTSTETSHTHDVATATQAEAEAGSINTKFVTPLRVKQAIDIFSTKVENSVTNGNIKVNGIETPVYTHPNHTGDVTSVGDGITAISNNAVTFAKMQNIATGTFLGRNSSGTGNIEALSSAQVKTLLVLSNVENKSSATIRGEITSGNVTTALGYTPTKKFVANLGDGSATNIAVTHNFGTKDVQITVYEVATNEVVYSDIAMTDNNTVTFGFGVAPTNNQYRAVLVA